LDDGDDDTTYTAGGTLLNLTGTTFSLNEGTLTNGRLCTYDSSNGLVCNTDSSNLALGSIDNHSDVDTTTNTPSNGQVLSWDGSNWVPATVSSGADSDWTISGSNQYSAVSGNVGIGTSSPTYKLDVTGTGHFTDTLTIGSYTLPNTDGSNGQVLKTDGSGNLSWSDDNNTTYTNGNGLTLSGTTFSINSPTCSGTDKLQWNGTSFICSTDENTNLLRRNGTLFKRNNF